MSASWPAAEFKTILAQLGGDPLYGDNLALTLHKIVDEEGGDSSYDDGEVDSLKKWLGAIGGDPLYSDTAEATLKKILDRYGGESSYQRSFRETAQALVTQTMVPDTTPPVVTSATADFKTVVIHFNERVTDPNTIFIIRVNGDEYPHASRTGSGTRTLTYTLVDGLLVDDVVTLDCSCCIFDRAGNEIEAFTDKPVTNNTTLPFVTSRTISANGLTLSFNFNRPVTGHAGYKLFLEGDELPITYASGDGTASLNFTPDDGALWKDYVYTASYGSGNTADSAGNALDSFSDESVTNNSTYVPDFAAPTLASATIDATGLILTLVFNEAVDGHAGFTLSSAGGRTLTYTSGDGTTSKVFAISSAVTSDLSPTLNYTPGDVEDLSPEGPNAMLIFSAAEITNGSEVEPSPDANLSPAVRADGWTATLTFEGFTTGATYDFGLTGNNEPSASTPYLRVTSLGFDATGAATTVVRNVYLTKVLRKPDPDSGDLEESESGGNLTTVFALSDYVYAKDASGVGNSGTAPVLVCQAGFATNTGGASETSGNVSAGAVTNSSTADYPSVIAQWDAIAGVRTADRVSGTFSAAVNARHGFGIAAIKLDATGLTSAATVSHTVTTQTATARSATGFYANAFVASFDTSGFTTGERIALRARCYPVVGDTSCVLDTDSFTTATDEPVGRNKATVVYASTPKYAYVSTSGSDGTGVASTTAATAAASPFQSIGKAIQNDATVIRLLAGTHPALRNESSSRRATNEWYVVQPAPGESSATVTVQIDRTRNYNCERLHFRGVTVTLLDDLSWLDGQDEGDFLRFSNCVFSNSGSTPLVSAVGYRSNACYLENCTGDLGASKWNLNDFSTARTAHQFDGCVLSDSTVSSSAMGAWYRVVACSATGSIAFGPKASANVAPTQTNLLFDHNSVTGWNNNTNPVLMLADNINLADVSVSGNLVEAITSATAAFKIGADASTATVENLLVDNNTIAGSRFNCLYNDTGSTAYARTNCRLRNNLIESWATKHDTFPGGSGANGVRVGGWPVLFGAGARGNFSPHIASIGASGSFLFEFIGVNSYQPAGSGQPPAGSTNVTGFVKFVSRTAWNGITGATGGDYHLAADSPARSIGDDMEPYDIEGNARASTDAAGAYAQ